MFFDNDETIILVKSSNALFTPKKAEMVGGMAIHRTRYSIESMTAIFKSQILSIVSSKDRPFLKRLFENAQSNGSGNHSVTGAPSA